MSAKELQIKTQSEDAHNTAQSLCACESSAVLKLKTSKHTATN